MPAHPRFAMPKPVRITGSSSSITNSFVNGIIPVIWPTESEVDEALYVLGMEEPVCAYCGDTATEWDHFRPLVVAQKPTGYISEIHNLVPSCGKCNQSKGNKNWLDWMRSGARLSPQTRGIADIEQRIARLEAFERWGNPSTVNFEELVGGELWAAHWENHRAILRLMREAEGTADKIRRRIAESHSAVAPPTPMSNDATETPTQ
ncbi:HNH endonuclease [Microbacterium sp. CFH 31415]|uniref:HNH endonuclease signature motif containing protein n=1 Tax=Microbacterium sp. CFH 31415 TaxID=2921732 RepID=UPI001F145C67|nr:HNH endonuclease [Microbacterium sp. CFH 31415]MCH6230158.1 HNH endonuclease [Microbacterium sp. CFH 31415]